MSKHRRQFDSALKAKVALEALKEHQTTAQLAARYGVHPTQIAQWKRQLLGGAPAVFRTGPDRDAARDQQLIADLYEQLGRLQMEVHWLQKKASLLAISKGGAR
jgi:transposase-like protein